MGGEGGDKEIEKWDQQKHIKGTKLEKNSYRTATEHSHLQ